MPTRLPRFLAESHALGTLALPIILSQLAYSLLGLIDTVMAGQAGAADQAAVALGVALWLPVFLSLMSVVQALSPIVAHHFGAGDHAAIVRDTHEGLWLTLAFSVLPLALMPTVTPFMHWAKIDPLLIDKTVLFLWGILLGLPAALLFRTLSFYCASINRTRPMMVLAFMGLGINALFNWLLIWGHWGFPALGGPGCGWATGIGMWFSLIALAAWTAWAPAYRSCYLWRKPAWPSWAAQKKLLRIGLPMGGAALVEVATFSSIALFVGQFGAAQIAANQVALNFSAMIFMIPTGLAAALTIRIGQKLGSGAARDARFVAWSGIALGLLIATLAIPFILLGRDAIVSLYSPDATVRQIASTLMLFSAIWQFADATQVIAMGALRGYKITLMPMLMMAAAFWIVGIPLGIWLGYTGWPGQAPLEVYGFWIGLVSGLVLVAIGLTLALRQAANAHLADLR